jgi:hypothetical protein
MTTTRESSDSSTRFLFTALASSSLLVATALGPALVSMASATTPSTTQSNHSHARADHRIVHHDARHDVVRFDFRSDTSRPAPGDRATDITTTIVDHQTARLVVQARARHLSRSGYRLMVAEILASDGSRFTLVVDYSTTPIDSRVSIERFASGRDVKCAGASWSISGPAHRVGASIPTSCLGDPGWVRVGVALTAAPHNLGTSWADDSRARGRVGDRHLELGPRQHQA